MVSLYILQNNHNRLYIGITGMDLFVRLKRHNQGEVSSTKHGIPWKIIYTERYATYVDARRREKQIKSWKGGNAFKSLLRKAAGSSNGRTSPSEGEYLGSSPSPAALRRKISGGVK